MSFRAVRSPLAPKMTMEQGSTGLRPKSKRQVSNSSNGSKRSMNCTMAKVKVEFNKTSHSGASCP